jgi:hypothetical protein
MTEQGLTQRQIIAELTTRSTHGDLGSYVPVGHKAATSDPDFYAHLTAWNAMKGEVRDAKVALPVIGLAAAMSPVTGGVRYGQYAENALAHLATLDPRSLVTALAFTRTVGTPRRMFDRLIERYLRELETNRGKWERRALQHRAALHTLYARARVKPSPYAKAILFERLYLPGSAFEAVAQLKDMGTNEAASAIQKFQIPFLVADGALGKRNRDPDLVLALIRQMSPAELVTNTKSLEQRGIRSVPALRAAYEEALAKAGESKRATSTLKTARAAEVLAEESPVLAAKLQGLQERQLGAGSIEGDWLVLGDRSGSMSASIQVAMEVAAALARAVKGLVHLVFFNAAPTYFDVTGKSLDEIRHICRGVAATGGTSIGVGLNYVLDRKLAVNGIAIVSDAYENTPPTFVDRYRAYVARHTDEPPVYLYRLAGSHGYGDTDLAKSMAAAGLELVEFDLRGQVDYYALPNIVQTMRASRYTLLDEIASVPLLTLNEVLPRTADLPVLPRGSMVV